MSGYKGVSLLQNIHKELPKCPLVGRTVTFFLRKVTKSSSLKNFAKRFAHSTYKGKILKATISV